MGEPGPGDAVIQLPKIDWPPLITRAHLSKWVRLRDVVLTVIVWAALVWILVHVRERGLDYLRTPRFRPENLSPPNWDELWSELSPFFDFVLLLVLWICFWAFVRRRHLRRAEPVPQPPALDPARHAGAFGLDAATLASWQAARGLRVHFGSDGRPDRADRSGGE